MKQLATLFLLCLAVAFSTKAQLITTSPEILQESSQNVTVTFKSSEGDAGMKGSTNCYAHTGVITNKSNGNWKNAPEWGDNSDKYKLKLVGTNKFRLTIGDIRSYYNITDPDEHVEKLCFVFRNADCSKTGRNSDGSDIFVDVFPDGLAVSLTSSAASNIFTADAGSVTFTAKTTMQANIDIFLNSIESTPVASVTANTKLEYANTFAVGDYDIIARATDGTSTVLDTISICCRNNSQNVAYSGALKQGATVNADGSVTFCLLAPAKQNVMLLGEWNGYKPTNAQLMNYQGDRFFYTTVKGLDLGKSYGYFFVVDDVLNVADPYATMILDPWSDKWIAESVYPNLKKYPSQFGGFPIAVLQPADSYSWQVKDFNGADRDNLVIYELLVRDFTDQQTIKAATARLDYIKSLGVTAVELMPIQEFDGNNSWGYNPNFYFAPDKAYGTVADYKQFIDECHARGLAVILDVVFNHAYGQHPWCAMYWDSTNSRPSEDNPFFNPVAPHNFSVGNDWRQENANVQQYFCDVLKYWINEYHVDGYRFDLVKGLGASNSYASDYDGGAYNQSRIDIMKKYAAAAREAKSNAYIIFESFITASEEQLYWSNGCMTWNKLTTAAEQALGGYSSNCSFAGFNDPDGKYVSFMESHDEERNAFWASQYAASGIKGNTANTMRRLGSNAALALMAKGSKMIWQFEEMGYDVSINDPGRTDPKPTHWEYLDDADRAGLVASYSELLKFRKQNPDLFSSQAESTVKLAESDWTYGRFITTRNASTGKVMTVAVNPNSSDATFSYALAKDAGTLYINSKSYGTSPSFNTANNTITIPAHGYVLISNVDPSTGIDNISVSKSQINVFPNPATDYITVDAADLQTVEVYSLTGACVARSAECTVDITALPAGNYIVKAIGANGVATSKIIKR